MGIPLLFSEAYRGARRSQADAVHQIAQQRGKEEWYSRFSLLVCKVEVDYIFKM